MRRDGVRFWLLMIRRRVLRETLICLATTRSPNSLTSDFSSAACVLGAFGFDLGMLPGLV
jgi:hypothetical protein